MLKYTGKRTIIALVLAIAVLVCAGESSWKILMVNASNAREELGKAQKEKNDLENKKDQLENDIDDMKGEQNTLKGELNKLNGQLTQIGNNLVALEGRINGKELEIEKTQEALRQAKETEAQQYEDMVWRVRRMYERNDKGNVNKMVGTLLGNGNFADILNTADGYERIVTYDQIQLDKFQMNRQLIEEHEALLQQEKVELDNLILEAETEKNKVVGLVSATNHSIAKYADEISEAEKQALAYEEEIKAKEDVIKQLAAELALSEEAANGEWRDISDVVFAEGDRYLLANLIYCEAGGEPYEGQVAVGAVVINRVLSAKFPDSVVGVIYQKRQFAPVASGRLDLALAANKATPSCYRAADEAMAGITNVGNCLFFRTPIPGLEGIRIGGHVFY